LPGALGEADFVRELARLLLEAAPESTRFRDVGQPDDAVVEVDVAKVRERAGGRRLQ
jgi:hypothetical protein